MLFSSTIFLFLFLPAFFICYFAVRKRAARNAILLFFSLIFYAWGEPLYLLLMLGSIAFNYFFALRVEAELQANSRPRARAWLTADVILNLALLGVYKYTGFAVSSLNAVAGLDIPVPQIALPIGISFYTFQIMSYVIDVYRDKVPAQRSIVFLGAYLAAFPQLIAGPIVRYETVAEELTDRAETVADVAAGARRFIVGLSKKVLIANTMASVCDALLENQISDIGAAGAWIAVLAYTMQIYFDFSGYSDMAIGLGLIMGFHYLENFNYPYTAVSVTDFWRRWHISLSTFFRDYVYIPLGGNRVSKPRWIFNMLVVWTLTGLWHGASVTFLLWGLYFGVLLVLEKTVWGEFIAKLPVVRRIYAIIIFVYGWVIFRAESFGMIGELTKGLVGVYGGGTGEVPASALLLRANVNTVFIITFVIALVAATPLPASLGKRLSEISWGGWALDAGAVLLLALCSVTLATGAYNPFIYFRF